MAEAASTQLPQTDLAIVREIERIATKVQTSAITDLEIALLMAHMPNLLREYRMLREDPAPVKQPRFDRSIAEPTPTPPRLHLVGAEEGCP